VLAFDMMAAIQHQFPNFLLYESGDSSPTFAPVSDNFKSHRAIYRPYCC
jgi:hypothetical protein